MIIFSISPKTYNIHSSLVDPPTPPYLLTPLIAMFSHNTDFQTFVLPLPFANRGVRHPPRVDKILNTNKVN